MPAFDYALLRAVWVPSGDAVTVGVVLQCRQARFLDARLVDAAAAAARLGLDADLLARALGALRQIVAGGPEAGPVGRLPASERFHFLTATRSTALQPSPVRTGVTDDAAAALDRIAASLFGASAYGDRADPGTPRAPSGV
ncbi:hypothetical protein B1759_10375 [Rubrivirga sp. SAORIC476]|uniref:DUF3037 domain-containing protein n=1 Tax=Rubrivirga sp. SAORIC476 TaxID=1961794 RepID=UPI000BA90E9F|nr:DUF3037 domain-containing protein [Rubrivirga sp. SAORIC476]MAQ95872.1 DUF3037 domain-containing protein [Rhodothermaceae bacterium]MBC12648.1 DUF3037 domain-containing protein [Rhodothermaceae bacterium]PAP81694.1 hypothetical protein B1759_10375 [Rubrivirga sp. SAORIC476]